MKGNSSKSRSKKGFTLVELVVVIAVLAILAGVGVVAYNGYITYAQKGNDKQTVGEIMHALELANYANPGLINGYTEVYFTSENGIKVPLDLDGRITASLEDAFGAGTLGNIKPSYEGWKDQSFAGVAAIKEFLDSESITVSDLSELQSYIDATKNGGVASYSGDTAELWNTLHSLVDTASSSGVNIPGVDASDMGSLMKKAIQYTLEPEKHDAGSIDEVINKWANGDQYTLNDNTGAALFPVIYARNIAFVSYARRQNLTSEQKDALDKYTNPLNADLMINGYMGAADLTGAGFDGIMSQYTASGQARTDALAYFALMETANEIDFTSDEDFFKKTDSLSNVLGIMLGNPSVLNEISSSSYTDPGNTDVSGTGIAVKVTNMNGVLSFSVDPIEADPGGRSSKLTSELDEGLKQLYSYKAKDVTNSVKIDLSTGTLTATSTGGESTLNNVIWSAAKNFNVGKSLITVPDGWTVTKISCLGVEQTPETTAATVVVPVATPFKLSLGGNSNDNVNFNNYAVIMNLSDSPNEKSTTSVTIVFEMKDTNGNTQSVSVAVNLYYIGQNV